MKVSRVLPPVPPRSFKSDLAKFKFHQNSVTKSLNNQNNNNNKCSYIQVSSANIKEIIKIKDLFPQLSSKKIEEIHNTINKPKKKKPYKKKLYINITIKDPSRK